MNFTAKYLSQSTTAIEKNGCKTERVRQANPIIKSNVRRPSIRNSHVDFSYTAQAYYTITDTVQSYPVTTWLCCSIITFLSWKYGRDKMPDFVPIDECPDPLELVKQLMIYILNRVNYNFLEVLHHYFVLISSHLSPVGTFIISVLGGIFRVFNSSSVFHQILKYGGFFTFLTLAFLVLDYYFELYCGQRPIKNVARFSPNGGFSLPILGNLLQFGKSSPLTYWLWESEYQGKNQFAKLEQNQTENDTTTPRHFAKGADPCLKTQGHAPKAASLFQVRLGSQRAIVVNGYDTIKTLWQTNWSSNCSRPVMYTFHKVLSSGQGATIGTTPFSPDWRNMRRIATKALNTPSVNSYVPIIEKELTYCLQELTCDVAKLQNIAHISKLKSIFGDVSDSKDIHSQDFDFEKLRCGLDERILDGDDGIEIDIQKYFETYALKVSLAVAYGTCPQQPAFLNEVIYIEKQINRIRSSLHTVEDYLPFTRHPVVGRFAKQIVGFIKSFNLGVGIMMKKTSVVLDHDSKAHRKPKETDKPLTSEMVLDIRARRGKYMKHLMNELVSRIAAGDETSCIVGRIIKSKALNEAQLQSTCLTMVSAGLDTIPVNIISAIGHLSKPYGQQIQQKAFDEILEEYMDPAILYGKSEDLKQKERQKAWMKCIFGDSFEETDKNMFCKFSEYSKTLDNFNSPDCSSTSSISICSFSTNSTSAQSSNSRKGFKSGSKTPYLTAILWESMRHSSAQPINLARETIEEIRFTAENGYPVEIPAGTVLIMNTLAANFDEKRFPNPFKFDPERYLRYTEEELIINDAAESEQWIDRHHEINRAPRIQKVIKRHLYTADGIPHLSFGAGARVCAGSKLAEQEMSLALERMILCYEILPVDNPADSMETNIWRRFETVDSMVIEPEPFFVKLKPRREAIRYLNSLIVETSRNQVDV